MGLGHRSCGAELHNEKDLVRWMVRVAAVNSNTIVLQRALPVSVKPSSMDAQVHRIPPTTPRDVGVRDLTIEFAWETTAPHRKEKGYNALYIDGVVNAFFANIQAINVDSGILVRNSHYITITNVSTGSNPSRAWALPYEGHIGIGVYDSSDILVNEFHIDGEWMHDLAVRGTMFAVFSNGKGDNVNLDTHRSAPYATLFSNINLGKGLRVFGTGGHLARGFPAAQYTTYYNIRSMRWQPLPLPGVTMAGNCTWGYGINYIGTWTGTPCPGYHVENYEMGSLQPPDLYGSMVDRKYSQRAGGNVALPTLAQSEGAIVDNRSNKEAVVAPPPAGDGAYPVISLPDVY